MAKDTQGIKLQKSPAIRDIVVGWVFLEPSITDHAISQRLKKEENFNIAPQSVKAWRENFFPALLEEHKKKVDVFNQVGLSAKVGLKMSSLQDINKFIDIFKERLEVITKVLPTYDYAPTVVKNEDGEDVVKEIVYVGKGDIIITEQHQSITKFLVEMMKERDRLIGNFNPFDVAQETVQEIMTVITKYVKFNENSEEYKRLKEELIELEGRLRERYDTGKK